MNIKDNIFNLIENLPARCKLVAVSKTQPVELIKMAYDAGHKIFGENKAQELVQKYEALPRDIEWHMIGHLQSNKVKLLHEINKQGLKNNRIIPCLLQVHIAAEETKFGFAPDEVIDLIQQEEIGKLANIQIVGLMGMATFTDDTEKVRAEFRILKKLFDTLKSSTMPANIEMKELSMGMSGDFQIAVEEGSTIVRVGTAIFGERQYT